MKLTVDSPELTAFALGELDPGLAHEVARVVAADPALQREVEAIQRSAFDLTAALAAEPVAALEPERRTRLLEEARGLGEELPVPQPARPRRTRQPDAASVPWWTRFWPVAVGLASVAVVAVLWSRTGSGVGRMARLDDASSFDRLRYQPDRPASAPAPVPAPAPTPAPAGAVVPPAGVNPSDAKAKQDLVRQLAVQPAPTPVSRPVANASKVEQPAPAGPGNSPSVRGETRQRTATALGLAPSQPATASAPPPPPPSPEPTLSKRYGLAPARQPDAGTAGGADYRWQTVAPSPVDRFGRPAAAGASRPDLSFSKAGAAETVRESEVLLRQSTEWSEGGLGGGRGFGEFRGVVTTGYEGYAAIQENAFRSVTEAPLSTFGLDVDTASYANVRRFLREGSLPPADAVRLEEMINYFRYSDPAPDGEHPVVVHTEMAECPWAPANRLLRVAVRSKEIRRTERPPANLVFLVDVSGSMEPENKLPLVKRTLRLLVERLTARDSVAIVTYAGDAGVALPPTNGGEKAPILKAIEALKSGGSTHGSAGITTAYELAARHFVKDGINRVLLCTDGDFNVGLTSRDALLELITEKAKTGVFLSVLGYGMGNYKDETTELLADRGNGNYAYVDSYREAQKVLQEQLESTLVTVARDVKLQLEFNPARVARYRLLGYENRLLADRDFNDDTKDAGEVGAGLSVTALYEIVPTGGGGEGVDPLRYGRAVEPAPKPVHTDEWLLVKLRYQKPEGSPSQLLTRVVKDGGGKFEGASPDLRFSSAAAGFGMVLRNSAHKGSLTFEQVARMAEGALGEDPGGYRAEMVDLVRRAQQLGGRR